MNKSVSPVIVSLAALVLAGSVGCSTPPAKSADNKADEYITYYDTGSNIPRRIKKSDIVAGSAAANAEAQQEKNQLEMSMKASGTGPKNN